MKDSETIIKEVMSHIDIVEMEIEVTRKLLKLGVKNGKSNTKKR